MTRLVTLIFAAILIVLVGGAIFLATWDIPAPTRQIEKPIPDDRLPK
ncbi:MAG: hypothetical protein P4M00_11115 [Azospirillaceae bacterium]|nr:hypothetical protein [Azospirillaceae bacterium]